METEQRAAGERSREHVIEVVLVDGGRLEARVGADEERARTELAGLHARLHEDAFLRVGDDTIVRAGEVRWLQLRPRDGGDGDGLMSTVMNTIRGGDAMGNYETHHAQQGGGGGQMPWIGYGRRPYSETKPFFLTSEFVAFAGISRRC